MSANRANWSRSRFMWALALSIVGIAVAADAWADIIHIAWRDQEASHILLVPIVFGYLVWVRRKRLWHLKPQDRWVGPVMIAIGWACHAVGDVRLWQSIWHLGAILIVVGGFLTAMGAQVFRAFLPAFLVLLFLIPVPGRIRQRIALPMQNATARATEQIFNAI